MRPGGYPARQGPTRPALGVHGDNSYGGQSARNGPDGVVPRPAGCGDAQEVARLEVSIRLMPAMIARAAAWVMFVSVPAPKMTFPPSNCSGT